MEQSPVRRIIEAIAEAEGRDPHELDVRLHDHVDTDGIRRLAGSASDAWTLSFELPDHEVTVHGDGRIRVDTLTPAV